MRKRTTKNQNWQDCPECDGHGYDSDGTPCWYCDGTAIVYEGPSEQKNPREIRGKFYDNR